MNKFILFLIDKNYGTSGIFHNDDDNNFNFHFNNNFNNHNNHNHDDNDNHHDHHNNYDNHDNHHHHHNDGAVHWQHDAKSRTNQQFRISSIYSHFPNWIYFHSMI